MESFSEYDEASQSMSKCRRRSFWASFVNSYCVSSVYFVFFVLNLVLQHSHTRFFLDTLYITSFVIYKWANFTYRSPLVQFEHLVICLKWKLLFKSSKVTLYLLRLPRMHWPIHRILLEWGRVVYSDQAILPTGWKYEYRMIIALHVHSMKQLWISVNWVPGETSVEFLMKYLDFYFLELCRARMVFWTTVWYLQFQQLSECSLIIFTHNFIDFGHCLRSWNKNKSTWTLVILGAFLALRKSFMPFENTCKMKNSHHRPLSTIYSTQSEFSSWSMLLLGPNSQKTRVKYVTNKISICF